MNKTKIFSNLFALIASLVMVTNPVLAQLTPVQQQSVPITNLVPNSGFESGVAQWTKTGGNWSVVTSGANLGSGTTSLCWTPTAAGQKLRSTAVAIPNTLKTEAGTASISLKIPTGNGTYKINVTDGSGVILDSDPIRQNGSNYTENSNFSFLYGQSVSGKIQLELESVAASEPMICLDDAFVGKAYNVKQAQTRAVGDTFFVAGATCPIGSLIANGAAVSRVQYSDLYSSIGTIYGTGDGSTTFNLPNLQGIFVRGTGSQTFGSKTYSGTLGTKQNDAFASHTHQVLQSSGVPQMTNTSKGLIGADSSTGLYLNSGTGGQFLQSTGSGTETLPANISMTPCVQYQPPVQVYDVGQVVDSTGTSITYNGAVCPAGTLDENGASVLRANYPKLFNKIGTAWGNGSTNPSGVSADSGCPHASNCFNIPDKRGRFNRTVAVGSANDPDRASRTAAATGGNSGDNVGSVQGHAFQTHTHTQNSHSHLLINSTYLSGAPAAANQLTSGTYIATGIYGSPYDTSYTLYPSSGNAAPNVGPSGSATATNNNAQATGSTAQVTANETRPVNVNVKSCIIYDGTIYTPVFAGAVTSKSNTNGVTVINTPKSISADYNVTADEDVIYVDTSGGVRNVNLPNAAQFPGKRYEILVSSDSNYANVNATNSQTVCGLASVKVVGKADSFRVQSIGGNWVGIEGTCYREVFGFAYGSGTNSSCSASPCLLTRSQGVANVTRGSTGSYAVNLSPAFSDNPIFCHTSMSSYTSSASVLAFNVRCQVGSSSSISIDFGSGTTTGMDSAFTFLVKGLR